MNALFNFFKNLLTKEKDVSYYTDGEVLDSEIVKSLSRDLEAFRFACKQCKKTYVRVYPRHYNTFVCHQCKF